MGFAEPHRGRDGLPSLLAARGAVQELRQAALHPGGRLGWARGGGQPGGMGLTAQGFVCWGQGLEWRWCLMVLTLARSCLVLSIISGCCQSLL